MKYIIRLGWVGLVLSRSKRFILVGLLDLGPNYYGSVCVCVVAGIATRR